MILSLILIGATTITFLAVYTMSGRAYEVADPILAGETTVIGLNDAATDTQQMHSGGGVCVQNDWNLATVTELHEAEDMLDYLEAQGFEERELMILGNSCFAVRWK